MIFIFDGQKWWEREKMMGEGVRRREEKNCLQAVFLTVFSPRSLPLYGCILLYKTTNTAKQKSTSYTGKIVSDPYVYNNKTEGKPENRPYVTSNNSPYK